ncbi:MAG TPA: aldehyde dehydrogenase [Oligoflexus sp.]|uniref:aldehyde dehydrogenase n=1 Tax=Oligoflexus sp. TaxID=1971216 RepID=UPI002D2F2742|nr:aldehyde dehydrogenase [Oligoflexus sp.]HYX38150.1 aldehyde dehydrogenase [Oligoflexus sp.]
MDRILNYIDGSFVAPASGQFLDNYRPRDGAVYGQLPDSTAADVDRAVAAAKAAFPAWHKLKRQERAQYLYKIADAIEQKLDIFAAAESRDQGKPIHLARSMDIPRAVENFRFFAGAILHQQERAFQTSPEVLNYTRREPVGVAGLISPWNLPLYLLTWKIAPALAAGNTAVAKPSELTPATAFLLAQVMDEVGLPKGVCNLVFGLGEKAGDALVAHPYVPLISFTGGTDTAAIIGRRAAPLYKKISFELGGKNPGLIFADCDLEAALTTTVRSSFLNQGEICLCTSRLFVQESLLPKFTELFVERIRQLKVGDPESAESFMGPLVSAEHLEKVDGFVQRAKAQGHTILCGGERVAPSAALQKGFYFAPTVISTQDASSEIMQQEVFGPVVTITPFTDYADAVEKANSTRYGLAATIWTQNLDTAHHAAADIKAGQIWVNTWMLRDLRVPFGGMKDSGIGREGGDYSLEFYTEEKNVCLQIGRNRL